MPTKSCYELNYDRLETLLARPLGDLPDEAVFRLRAPGFMDLVVEILPRCRQTGAVVLSLAHYFELNGDLCQDPEMTVRLFAPRTRVRGRIEALSFQQAIPPIYQVVYPGPGMVAPLLKRQLNAFLSLWLENLLSQGHRIAQAELPAEAERRS